jgi:hypothetical protein
MSELPIEDAVSNREDSFCRHFARMDNGAAAARAAGYAPSSAANQASKLLKRPEIKARVEGYRAEYLAEENEARLAVGPVYTLGELKNLYEDEETSDSVKLGAIKLMMQLNGLLTQKEEQQARDGHLKIIVGLDPAKAGLTGGEQQEGAATEAVEEEAVVEEEPPVSIPMDRVPVKQIILGGPR